MYTIKDQTVSAIASLMGCEPSHGLVNRMNKIFETAQHPRTYGDMHRAMLLDMLAECDAMDGNNAQAA